ncbi:hypothetical protein AB0K89_15780 [Streptomyces cinnamoneus]|uniref:hypothetical protein n=1 Tax=Streptomyces cinnamoneus TaxID=53446 RepID=UPI003419AA80
MPRPTPAQIAYGSATVVFSTLAMLLLSQAGSGIGVAVIALTALALGLAVAAAAGMRKPRVRAAAGTPPSGGRTPAHAGRAAAGAVAGEHSLHG